MKKDKHQQPQDIVLRGNTISEQFQFWLGEHRRVSDIIAFLGAQNARLLAELSETEHQDPRNLPPHLKNQIMDFTEDFLAEYGEVTLAARLETWGSADAFLFRVADVLFAEELEHHVNEMLETMTETGKKEVETLVDTLFSVKAPRVVTATFGDGTSEQLILDRVIPRFDRDYIRLKLTEIIADVIATFGSVLVKEEHGKTTEIYGFSVSAPLGIWTPVSAELVEEYSLVTASGIRLEPEPNTVFVCRPREKF